MRRLRALWTGIWFGGLTCVTCGRRRVGLSRFCRRHTDEILHRANTPQPEGSSGD